jgi:hypothetical protein
MGILRRFDSASRRLWTSLETSIRLRPASVIAAASRALRPASGLPGRSGAAASQPALLALRATPDLHFRDDFQAARTGELVEQDLVGAAAARPRVSAPACPPPRLRVLPTWPARRSMSASWSGCRYTVIGTRAMFPLPLKERALRITGAQGGRRAAPEETLQIRALDALWTTMDQTVRAQHLRRTMPLKRRESALFRTPSGCIGCAPTLTAQ